MKKTLTALYFNSLRRLLILEVESEDKGDNTVKLMKKYIKLETVSSLYYCFKRNNIVAEIFIIN